MNPIDLYNESGVDMKSNSKRIVVASTSLLIFVMFSTTTMTSVADALPAAAQSLNNNHILAYADKSDADKKDAHGKHHADDDNKHHGKCSMMSNLDTDKDGKISKREFIKHHKAKFDKKDLNNDGFIDKEEMRAMMKKHKHGHGHDHGHDKKEMNHKAHEDKQE